MVKECNQDWFVLTAKFDKSSAPIKVMAQAFDHFFSLWGPDKDESSDLNPAMKKAFDQVCHTILSTIDNEGFSQLFELIPSLAHIFPEVESALKSKNQDPGVATSSIDKVGSATKRRMILFHVLLASMCSAGYPVLVVFDEWVEAILFSFHL